MKIKIIAFVSIFVSFGAMAGQCNKDNFDKCKSCDQLSKAIDLKNPDYGDYYRGALWNGLYASYVRNCPAVAEKLLSRGATPSLGGYLGSMGGVITGRWPHNNESINLQWADLLIKHGFSVSSYTGEYKSATDVWAEDESSIEHKEVWERLVSAGERKPVEASKEIKNAIQDYYNCSDYAAKRYAKSLDSAEVIADGVLVACEDYLKETLNIFDSEQNHVNIRNRIKFETMMKERARGFAIKAVLDVRSR